MTALEPIGEGLKIAPKRCIPAMYLFFLPAIVAELLTGNTPLSEFLKPSTFVILNLIYGGAALLIREVTVRWNKGFASIILFGMAYGVVNEGLASKGFFDPHFYAVIDFGLENVGRMFGINVAWAVSIVVFHAIFSIVVPILLVTAVFPEKSCWLGNKSFSVLLVLLGVLTGFLYYHMNVANMPALSTLALVLFFIVLFIVVAKIFPTLPVQKYSNLPSKIVMFGCGALFAFAIAFTDFVLYRIIQSFGFYVGILIGLMLLFTWLMLKLPPIPRRSQIALVSGLLMPLMVAAVVRHLFIPLVLALTLLALGWGTIKPA